MHWLSQNYQWIVSGIGVLILALLIERWRRSSQNLSGEENNATLTAQGVNVENSPIASGSGNKQNINALVFNVNIGQPAAAPAQAEPVHAAPAPRQRSLPNLNYSRFVW